MSRGTLSGARAKHARAAELLTVLENEVRPFLQVLSDTVDEVIEAGGARHLFSLREPPTTPASWSVLIGDILHNLRSALDHLAWQLVVVSGSRPTIRTYFPILDEPKADGPQLTPSVLPAILEVLDQVQPYRAVPDLRFLQYLSRIDKHREILTTVAYWEHVGWGVPDGVTTTTRAARQPVDWHRPFFTVECQPPYARELMPRFEFRLAAHPGVFDSLQDEPGFDPQIVLAGDLLDWGLRTRTHFVGRVLDRFERFFDH